jgi:hypothetical protein
METQHDLRDLIFKLSRRSKAMKHKDPIRSRRYGKQVVLLLYREKTKLKSQKKGRLS